MCMEKCRRLNSYRSEIKLINGESCIFYFLNENIIFTLDYLISFEETIR